MCLTGTNARYRFVPEHDAKHMIRPDHVRSQLMKALVIRDAISRLDDVKGLLR